MAEKTSPPPQTLSREAMEKLIRETASSLGEQDPATLPHMVRERLKGQLTANADVEEICRAMTREQRGRR